MFERTSLLKIGTALLLIGITLGIMGTSAIAAPPEQDVESTDANVTNIFGLDSGGIIPQNSTALTRAQNLGTNWLRIAVNWGSIEPTKGDYDWTTSDGAINPLLDAGLSPYVYISDNPNWAANTPCGPIDTTVPNKLKVFGDFIEKLVARYPKVKRWALYNEVDNADYPDYSSGGCFGSSMPGGLNDNGRYDYEDYALMLAKAWEAVHAANPKAKLAVGALAFDNFDQPSCPPGYSCAPQSHFNYNFVSNLFNYMGNHPLSQGQKYMDVVSFNYYDLYGPYWETQAGGRGIQAKANELREKMAAAGLELVPLFVTETGEDSNPGWIGKKGQARCLDIFMVRGAATYLQGIVWWTFQDTPNLYYGIVSASLKHKLSFNVYKSLIARLEGYQFKSDLSGSANLVNVEAYEFRKGSQRQVVVWSSSVAQELHKAPCADPRNPRTAGFDAKKLEVRSMKGKKTIIKDNSSQDLDATVGRIAINTDGSPQFVLINP